MLRGKTAAVYRLFHVGRAFDVRLPVLIFVFLVAALLAPVGAIALVSTIGVASAPVSAVGVASAPVSTVQGSGLPVATVQPSGQGFLVSVQDNGPALNGQPVDYVEYSGELVSPPTACPAPGQPPPSFLINGGGGPVSSGDITVASSATGESVTGSGHALATDFTGSVIAGPAGQDPVGSLTLNGFFTFAAKPTCLSVSGHTAVIGYQIAESPPVVSQPPSQLPQPSVQTISLPAARSVSSPTARAKIKLIADRSIGEIALGERRSAVQRRLGAPLQAGDLGPGMEKLYPYRLRRSVTAFIVFDHRGRVSRIETNTTSLLLNGKPLSGSFGRARRVLRGWNASTCNHQGNWQDLTVNTLEHQSRSGSSTTIKYFSGDVESPPTRWVTVADTPPAGGCVAGLF